MYLVFRDRFGLTRRLYCEEERLDTSAILSRRVFQSPFIKWICPARIRDKSKNDVAFVGETLLHLKEWDARSGVFIHVASIENFACKILAAAVLGGHGVPLDFSDNVNANFANGRLVRQPPQILVLVLASHELVFVTVNKDEQNHDDFCLYSKPIPVPGPEDEAETLIAVDSQTRAMAVANSDKSLLIYGLVSSKSYRLTSLKSLIQTELILPIDMVVLKMDFLYSLHEDPDRVMLVVYGVADDKYVADVYSWEFSKLSNPESIHVNRHPFGRDHGFPLSLIPLRLDGYFMLVEEENMFLYLVSPSGSVEQTASTVLSENGLETLRNSRDSSSSPSAPLWTNWARPLRRTDWEREAIYLGREDGVLKYVEIARSKPTNRFGFEMLSSGGELDSDIGTAMAILDVYQAPRNEDERSSAQSGYPDFRPGYPDTLLVASTSGSGALYEIGSPENAPRSTLGREKLPRPRKREIFLNWGSFSAITTAEYSRDSPRLQLSSQPALTRNSQAPFGHRDRLFVSTGSQPNGAICEIRHGFEIPLIISKDPQRARGQHGYHEEYDLKHCNGVWPVDAAGHGILIVFSYPWCTIVAMFDRATSSLSDSVLFDYNETTLDLTTIIIESPVKSEQTGDGGGLKESVFILCVCPTHVRILRLQPSRGFAASPAAINLFQILDIPHSTYATFRRRTAEFLIAIPSNSENHRYEVSLARLVFEHDEFKLDATGEKFECITEITSLAFIESNMFDEQASNLETQAELAIGRTCAVIGTSVGFLHLVVIGQLAYEVLSFDSSEYTSTVSESKAIESIAVVGVSEESTSFQLLWGSRNGTLHILYLERDTSSEADVKITWQSCVQMPAGNWPLRVFADRTNIGCVIVYCGSDIAHINVVGIRGQGLPEVSSVYFSDPNDPSFYHGTINAMTQTPVNFYGQSGSECLVAVSEGRILAGYKSRETRALPLWRLVPGTPTRLFYSKQLKRLVVCSKISELIVSENKRYTLPTIFCIDPDGWSEPEASQQEVDSYDIAQSAFRCQPGERVLDMMECFIQRDGQMYHFIVVSIIIEVEEGQHMGKLLFLNDKQGLSLAFETKEPAPVFAICQTTTGSLVYCCGHEVRMRVYDPEQRKFQKYSLWSRMASPGLAISTRDRLVMVVTQHHSLFIFELDESKQILKRKRCDRVARKGISCLNMPRMEDVVLETTESNRIVGFGRIRELLNVKKPYSDDSNVIFEATLRNRVTHLAQANLRSPWKRYKLTKLQGDDIYGISPDGSLLSFNLLKDPEFEVLHFVQLMCLRDPRVCPFPPKDAMTHRSFDAKKAPTREKHIDGDILASLLRMREPEKVLAEMLAREPVTGFNPTTGIPLDFMSAEARQQKLKFLLRELQFSATLNLGTDYGDVEVIDLERSSAIRVICSFEHDGFVRLVLNYITATMQLPL